MYFVCLFEVPQLHLKAFMMVNSIKKFVRLASGTVQLTKIWGQSEENRPNSHQAVLVN